MKSIYYIFCLLLCTLFSCTNTEKEAQESYDKGVLLMTKDNQLNEAAERFLHALSLQDENIPTPLLASTYEHISKVYWEQDYTEKAITFALKGMECSNKLNNDSIRCQMLNRVASSYYLNGDHKAAIHYYDQLKDLAIKRNDSIMVLNAINNVGAVLLSQKKYEEAMKKFNESQKFSPNREKDIFIYHYNLSRCYQNMNKWAECSKEIDVCMNHIDSGDVEALGKLYRRMYSCEKNLGNYDHAFACADSSYNLADKAFIIKQREELKDITELHQQEKHEAELKLERTHWMLAVVVIILISAIAFVLLMYRNKRRMIRLQQRMDSIKVQIARKNDDSNKSDGEQDVEDNNSPQEGNDGSNAVLSETPANQAIESPEDTIAEAGSNALIDLYAEQFKVARELFRMRPASNKLRQLRYHTDKNYLSDEVRMPLIDSVTEVFIDPMQGLRMKYPELTSDECLYAVLAFLGCNNAIISILTKTTEATLRKRRSRFKQKTNEQVFTMLMEG